MPVFGLGQTRVIQIIFSTYNSVNEECQAAVEHALRSGYRMVDTASLYISLVVQIDQSLTLHGNQAAVGAGIRKCLDEGVIKREDLFVTTKLWVTDWKPEDMEKAIQQCLKDLQLEYIDLYLIHWPTFFNLPAEEEAKRSEGYFFNYSGFVPDSAEYRLGYNIENLKRTWAKMEEFVKKVQLVETTDLQGYVHSIGISNFSTKKIDDLLSFCTIKPAVEQVELHPHLQQWELLDYCKKHDIAVTAYFPLGGAGNVNSKDTVPLMKDPILLKIAEAHGKTSAQIMIRWAIQRGTICIPKSTNPGRIEANSQIFDFELTEEEMNEIRSMDKRHRYCNGFIFLPSPATWKDVWDGENLE